jgi:hypothetical protein
MTSERVREPRTWFGRVVRPSVDSSRSEPVFGLGYSALMTVGFLTEAGRRLFREHPDYLHAAFFVATAFAVGLNAPDFVRLLRQRRGSAS